MDVTLILPVHNERDNVGPLLAEIEQALGPTLRGLSAADASVVRTDIDARAKPFREGNELALPGLCWCGLWTMGAPTTRTRC